MCFMDKYTLWTIVLNVNMPVYSMWTSLLYADKYALYGQVYAVDNCSLCGLTCKCTLSGQVYPMCVFTIVIEAVCQRFLMINSLQFAVRDIVLHWTKYT